MILQTFYRLCVTVMLLFFLNGMSFAQTGFKKLVWSDEFNQPGLPDTSKWGYDKGTGCPNLCGWGNNELQYYTWDRKENCRVENGKLIIQARKEAFGDRQYTSTRLVSKGKGDWKYGRIEISAKMPSGRGIWPALWMLPTEWKYGAWPKSGEIDIVEYVGYAKDSVFGTVHTGSFNHVIGNQKSGSIIVKDAETKFHLYSMEWDKDKIKFLVDNKEYYTYANPAKTSMEWPYDQLFHLVLNIAVGGGLGGRRGMDDSIFPQAMEVDYVRVYQ